MTCKKQSIRERPAAWVPTVYFAEGLPFYAVNFWALFFFQRMGAGRIGSETIKSRSGL
jgi:hypothetical protein